MIELVQAPDTNRVIADGNDTLIQVSTRIDPSYFVRATIYINNVEFLEQSWSKDEDGLVSFNLKHLYYSYFENEFSPEMVTGFNEKLDLYKKVKIVLKEFQVGSSTLISTLTLPEFFIIKNLKPQVFDDSKTVAFLDLAQENIKVDSSLGFVFPIYLKGNDLVTVSVLNPLGQTINTWSLQDYTTQITQFELNFEDIVITGLDYVFVKFTTAQHEIQKKLIFLKPSIFQPKQVFYLNNSGFYCVAYLNGKKEEDNKLSPKSYTQFDSTEITYDVEDTKELQLNSGHGYKEITSLIHAIATSIDVRIKLEDYWERVKSDTKKIRIFAENQFVYSEALNFSRVNVANFTNSNTYAIIPQISNIVKTGDENDVIEILKQEFLNVFIATQSPTRLRIRSLPINGKLSYETTEGIYNLSDMAANTPSIMPFTISLDTFIKVLFTPDVSEFGTPLDSIGFNMGSEVLLSNDANLVLNVNDIPDANRPPKILVNTIQEIALDGSGNGSKALVCGISDPDGDAISILWEALGGAPITFSDNTIQNPTITLNGGAINTTYQIKVTATDTANSLVTTRTINVNTSSYILSISAFAFTQGTVTEIDYKVTLSGGEPTKKVTVSYLLQAANFSQAVVINYNEPSERILYGGGSNFLDDHIIAANGIKEYLVKLTNETPEFGLSLKIRIESAEGNQFIDEANREVTISL